MVQLRREFSWELQKVRRAGWWLVLVCAVALDAALGRALGRWAALPVLVRSAGLEWGWAVEGIRVSGLRPWGGGWGLSPTSNWVGPMVTV